MDFCGLMNRYYLNLLYTLQVYVPENIHKFTFCIKSPGHFSDEYFCIVCIYLAKSLSTASKICKKKVHIFIHC